MTDTDDTDDARTDDRIHPFVAGATDPDGSADDGTDGTPFVPCHDRATDADGRDGAGPTVPTYGECLVAVLRGVFGR